MRVDGRLITEVLKLVDQLGREVLLKSYKEMWNVSYLIGRGWSVKRQFESEVHLWIILTIC